MSNYDFALMEQLFEAINCARLSKKTMYVFFDEGRWWYSGKLPKYSVNFYIAYATGEADRSGDTEEITAEAWNAFFVQSKKKFRKPVKIRKKNKKRSRFVSKCKKMFLGTCAFSPYIAIAISTILFHLLGKPVDWSITFVMALAMSPLSLMFILVALHKPKNGRIASLASNVAINAHTIIFLQLMAMRECSQFELITKMFPWAIMLSMLMSGVALLLMYDNEIGISNASDGIADAVI